MQSDSCMGGSPLDIGDSNLLDVKSALTKFVVVQGVVTRFREPEVREAFLGGHFLVRKFTSDILCSIDKIRELILPFPGYADTLQVSVPDGHRSVLGSEFFISLLRKSPDTPKDKDGEDLPYCMSFRDWYGYLQELSKSSVWTKLAKGELLGAVRSKNPKSTEALHEGQEKRYSEAAQSLPQRQREEGNAYPYSSPYDSKLNRNYSHDEEKIFPPRDAYWNNNRFPSDSNRYGMEDCNRIYKDRSHQDLTYPRKGYYTEDSENNSESTAFRPRDGRKSVPKCNPPPRRRFSDSSFSSEESYHVPTSRRNAANQPGVDDLSRLLMALQRPKNFVPPSKFDGSDGTSLNTFFREYETYFDGCFEGSDRQKAKQLAEFLGGPIKTAYEAMEGHKMSYNCVKPKLYSWYKTQRTNTRRKAEIEFGSAKMRERDSLSIYALRLERIASKAFPDPRECERQLIKKFTKTVPRNFNKALDYAEKNLVLMGTGRKLQWKQILNLAEEDDRKHKYRGDEQSEGSDGAIESAVWFSRPPTQPWKRENRKTVLVSPPRQAERTVTFGEQNSPSPSRPKQFQRGFPVCSWCGRRGHVTDGCWLRKGWCSACGSPEHKREDCTSPTPRPSETSPPCPVCGGEHWGKDCPNATLNRNLNY